LRCQSFPKYKKFINNDCMLLQDFNKTVADIVRSDYRTADVFKKYGIDYCLANERLLETCAAQNLDYNSILKELEAATKTITISNSLHFWEWKVGFLIDYIINVHHAYMHMAAPALENYLVSFVENHKKSYPEVNKILFLFRELSVLILTHSRHEEEIIFPYIRQIESTHRRKETYGNLFVRTLRKPLSNIEKEHEVIMSVLKEIQGLTNNYTSPLNACADLSAIHHKLEEFHSDMLQHTYLEDHILFPKAIEMEKELLQL
jgi:regulator of cell morphogenesis and NO signaling